MTETCRLRRDEGYVACDDENPGVENRAGESNGVVRAPVADTNARSADIFQGFQNALL